MTDVYHEGMRQLQDRFDSRQLADRLDERLGHSEFAAEDRAFIESRALFFLAMAVLNEIVWRTQSTDFWVAFKAFGAIPLTMGFAVTQMPLIKRYHLEPASLQASEAEAGDVRKG